MIRSTKDYWYLFKIHFTSFIIFLIGMVAVASMSFIVVLNNHSLYVESQLNRNIVEYNEIDREQLCFISDCLMIESKTLSKTFTPDDKGILHKTNYIEHSLTKLYGNLYISDDWHFAIKNGLSKDIFFLDTSIMVNDFINLLSFFLPLSIIIFMIPLSLSIKREKKEILIKLAGEEALLANKSMINITENIHHELNTPLEVIDNKLIKIKNEFYDLIKGSQIISADKKDKKLKELEEDFGFVCTASEQIYTVLAKMKNFKHLRYSNGNKTLLDIINGGFKIIHLSNSNFSYSVDERLAKYKNSPKALRNAELLNIIINHTKNSLEANGTKIAIIFMGYTNNKVRLRFIDNGTGIPKNIQKNIFKPNFSTKSSAFEIRGNGMYLNKHILSSVGGSIKLIESTPKGTTLELEIPAEEIRKRY